VAKRAEQLIQGAMPKMRSKHAKSTRVAMEEVNNEMIRWQLEPPPAVIEEPGEEQ
jgi:DNA-directed RNA polymerase subunit K/omega